jgi:glutamate N-acetyltransferase/amino-acid N-acetyltransferase
MSLAVTYPKGFLAGSTHSGLKKNNALDLCLIASTETASCAGVFTTNVVKGHSLQVCSDNVNGGNAKCIYINSGNANACVGKQGLEDAEHICKLISDRFECNKDEILPCSTGVIGVRLPMDKIENGIENAIESLSPGRGENAGLAIMTTDTHPKYAQKEIIIDGKPVRIGAIAKGSGMIHPNMATMISVITTDANISPTILQKM